MFSPIQPLFSSNKCDREADSHSCLSSTHLLDCDLVPIVVILIYSFFRKDKNQSSYLKAVARGLLGLPVGAIINALGAIALGAPIGTQYFHRTLNWSLLMSAFTFVPAASVYGSSWVDCQSIFVYTK
ncbi:hypothetical protein L2E82_01453 [Cichorium intybus]|uniref:Uncharacterized protein n=1 Tax=Cichorium intybus TaxID=13427 RepID=A0ACB9H011_CICIN|nr:hypothetical protein L2E82_01453 [Cichorium intybus]